MVQFTDMKLQTEFLEVVYHNMFIELSICFK